MHYLVLAAVVIVIGLGKGDPANARATRKYAYVPEFSNSSYLGVEGLIQTANPNLNGGAFTNETLWATDLDTCGGSWVETGWTKRADQGGQVRYKYQFSVPPSCVWGQWPNLGTPAIGSWHTYQMRYCNECGGIGWVLYIDGVWKAGLGTSWAAADRLDAGGEVTVTNPQYVGMGPANLQTLKYRKVNLTWTAWSPNAQELPHCDFPYNAYVNTTAIYNWGPDSNGPGCQIVY